MPFAMPENRETYRMIVTVEIPEEFTSNLAEAFADPARAVLEAFAAEVYERGVFSLEQVRRLLRLDNRWEAEAVLKAHHVWPGTTLEELEGDLATMLSLRNA